LWLLWLKMPWQSSHALQSAWACALSVRLAAVQPGQFCQPWPLPPHAQPLCSAVVVHVDVVVDSLQGQPDAWP